MRELLKRLPKVDLHCHLDGSVRPSTVLELARERGHKLPADNVADLTPFVQVGPSCRSLKDFLDVFAVIYPLLRDADAVERIAYELVEDCAAENIRHVEARFAPALQATRKFSTDGVVEAALKGLERGRRDFGTTSSVIVCLIRGHGDKESRPAFETLKKFFKTPRAGAPPVVALDLADDLNYKNAADFAPFFEEALALGIHTTCHVGEAAGMGNFADVLALGVERIGHGIHLSRDAKLMKEVVRRRVPLEISISSNLSTRTVPSLEEHPVRAFHQAGVPISLNTDDRGIIGIDLTHEYEQALKLGFSVAELAELSLASIDHAFLPAAQKAGLRASFAAEIKPLLEAAPQ